MTVTLLKPYATYAQGASVDLDNATEASLVTQGRATYTANPGNAFSPLTAAEQQSLRDGAALVTATQAAALLATGGGSVSRAVAAPPVVVFVGNSITNYGFEIGSGTTGGYTNVSEQAYALQLAGPCVSRVASVLTADASLNPTGDFGHQAVTLSGTILAEMQSLYFPALDLAGVVPGIVVGHSLIENDIANDVAAATITTAIGAWVLVVQEKYPNCSILLCTPRPDGRLQSNSTRIACANTVRDYMLSLENYSTIRVVNLSNSEYLDPTDPWTPLSGYTYSSNTSDAITTKSVHPRQNASYINGKRIAAGIRLLAGSTSFAPVPMKSINDTLTGSTSVATTRVTGTGPTNSSVSVVPTQADASLVCLALQPGWRATFTPGANSVDAFELRLAAYTPLKYPRTWAPYVVVKIVSGAESICCLDALSVTSYTTGTPANQTRHAIRNQAFTSPSVLNAAYANGDVLTLATQPTAYSAYVAPTQKPTTFVIDMRCNTNGSTPIVLEVQAMGMLFFDNLPIAAAITPGASPYQYFCPVTGGNQKVVVSGGTVSDISIGTNVSALFTTGQTAGMLPVSPGDVLQVTYTVVPTMTALPMP